MSSNHLLDELYRYNDWANRKIFDLCVDLPEKPWTIERTGVGSFAQGTLSPSVSRANLV